VKSLLYTQLSSFHISRAQSSMRVDLISWKLIIHITIMPQPTWIAFIIQWKDEFIVFRTVKKSETIKHKSLKGRKIEGTAHLLRPLRVSHVALCEQQNRCQKFISHSSTVRDVIECLFYEKKFLASIEWQKNKKRKHTQWEKSVKMW
jgi:hypothetical protein